MFTCTRLLTLQVLLWLLIPLDTSYATSDASCYQFDNIALAQMSTVPVNNVRGWSSFVIDGKYYLAAAQFTDNYPSGNKDINSTIFQWDENAGFTKFQTLLTHGARSWGFVTISGKHYLMVANLQTSENKQSPYQVNSVLYHWNGTKFVEYQKIPTDHVIYLRFMKINNQVYLALSSLAKPTKTKGNIHSVLPNIYKWDGKSFKPYQTIKQSQTYALSYFSINGRHYLGLGNGTNTSTIYQWRNDKFRLWQKIPINKVRGLKYFNHLNNHYLAFASQDNSAIYHWQDGKFKLFQMTKSTGGRDWLYLNFNNKSYLFLSHFVHDKPTGTNFNLTVYQFNGQLKKLAELPTNGIGQMIHLKINNKSYLLLSKLFSDSSIYEMINKRCSQ